MTDAAPPPPRRRPRWLARDAGGMGPLGRGRRRVRERLVEGRATRLIGPALTIATGTAAAQALVFATRPVLTRAFTPEAWGALTLFVTAITFLSAVASGGYRYAILLPARADDAANVGALALVGALLTGGLTAAGVAVGQAAGWLAPGALWWWLPPSIVLLEAGLTAETWLTRYDRFAPVSASRVTQQLVAVGVHVGAAALALGGGWLVGGTAAGYLASGALAVGWVAARGGPFASLWRVRAWRGLARRYVRFPLYSAPAALLNLVSTRVPVFVLAAFATRATVGQFGIAFGALALPLGLVTSSVGQVFFVRAAEAHRAGGLPALTRGVLRGLLAVTAFPCLAVVAVGPTLFAFVFGPAWAEAGRMAQVLAPWTLAASVAAPLTVLFDVLERQRADLGFAVVMAAGTTAALWAGGLLGSPLALVAAGSAAGTVLRVGHVAWMLHLARVPLGGPLADLGRALAAAVPMALALGVLDRAGAPPWAVLAATVAGGLAALALAARHRPGRAVPGVA